MGGVGTTLQNLEAAVAGETYEFTEMYPPMVKQAQAEGHKGRHMLAYALAAEQVHARLFKEALAASQVRGGRRSRSMAARGSLRPRRSSQSATRGPPMASTVR